MYYVIGILAFGILIAIHEAGHFIAAKAFGVKVLEFSLGMGPAILKRQKGETLYSLRALPIGGYCAMEGEDDDSDDPGAFGRKAAWKRAIILVAGAAMNFILGLVLILCISPHLNVSEPVIADFMPGCPYESAEGFSVGDRIVRIDGHRIYFSSDVGEYLARSGEKHDIVLRRDGKRIVLEDYELSMREYTLEDGTKEMKYGLYFAPRGDSVFDNIRYSWYESLNFVRLVWRSLGDLVRGRVGIRELSGPVGIVAYVNDVAQESGGGSFAALNIVYLFALIAVNLAVMNLLPIPALDGGRVAFLIITGLIKLVTGKRPDPKYEGYINGACLVLLFGFMAVIMFSDVLKLIFK